MRGAVNCVAVGKIKRDCAGMSFAQRVNRIPNDFFCVLHRLTQRLRPRSKDIHVGPAMTVALLKEPGDREVVGVLDPGINHQTKPGPTLLTFPRPCQIFGISFLLERVLSPQLPTETTGHYGKKS